MQIDSNNKEQCLTLMEIENKLQNEIIKIEKTINQLQILIDNHQQFKDEKENILKLIGKLNKQKIQLTNKLKEQKNILYQKHQFQQNYKFRLLYQDPMNDYQSFVFNSDSTLLFAGGHRFITVFKFKNGKKLLQKLTTPPSCNNLQFDFYEEVQLTCLCEGNSIVFWRQVKNNCWEPYQKLQGNNRIEGNEYDISIMIANEDEDLLIVYAYWVQLITFFKKVNTIWKKFDDLESSDGVISLSLNKSQTKLILCCYYKKINILGIQGDFKYYEGILQTNCFGLQLYWTSDSEFVFQGQQQWLEIYSSDPIYQKLYDCVSDKDNYNQIFKFLYDNEDFKIKNKIKVQNTQKYSEKFPCIYLNQRVFQQFKMENF